MIRAASSVAANPSEGHGRTGRDRFNHWRIAYGSAMEVDTFLRLLANAGVVDTAQTSVAVPDFGCCVQDTGYWAGGNREFKTEN